MQQFTVTAAETVSCMQSDLACPDVELPGSTFGCKISLKDEYGNPWATPSSCTANNNTLSSCAKLGSTMMKCRDAFGFHLGASKTTGKIECGVAAAASDAAAAKCWLRDSTSEYDYEIKFSMNVVGAWALKDSDGVVLMDDQNKARSVAIRAPECAIPVLQLGETESVSTIGSTAVTGSFGRGKRSVMGEGDVIRPVFRISRTFKPCPCQI